MLHMVTMCVCVVVALEDSGNELDSVTIGRLEVLVFVIVTMSLWLL